MKKEEKKEPGIWCDILASALLALLFWVTILGLMAWGSRAHAETLPVLVAECATENHLNYHLDNPMVTDVTYQIVPNGDGSAPAVGEIKAGQSVELYTSVRYPSITISWKISDGAFNGDQASNEKPVAWYPNTLSLPANAESCNPAPIANTVAPAGEIGGSSAPVQSTPKAEIGLNDTDNTALQAAFDAFAVSNVATTAPIEVKRADFKARLIVLFTSIIQILIGAINRG